MLTNVVDDMDDVRASNSKILEGANIFQYSVRSTSLESLGRGCSLIAIGVLVRAHSIIFSDGGDL